MDILENKVAVITGATSGIGEAVCHQFAKLKINMVLHGRNEQQLIKLSQMTNSAYLVGDITQKNTPEQLLQMALGKYGRCDILINNAGILEYGSIEDINIEKVCQMVRVNVEAAFNIVYYFVKHFKKQNDGDLVNISSVLGTKVQATGGAYAGTKFALEALSEALRMELACTNVRITCIEPGLVKTLLHRHLDVAPTVSRNIPNPLVPSDIADSVVYILQQDRNIRIPKFMILPKDHII